MFFQNSFLQRLCFEPDIPIIGLCCNSCFEVSVLGIVFLPLFPLLPFIVKAILRYSLLGLWHYPDYLYIIEQPDGP